MIGTRCFKFPTQALLLLLFLYILMTLLREIPFLIFGHVKWDSWYGEGVLTCRDIITSWYLRDTRCSSGRDTDYGHTMAKSQILCGPNSNLKYLGFGYKGLVFSRNNGWLMENMDKRLTVPKMGADKLVENTPDVPEFIWLNCLPKPKSLGFWWEKASLGVSSPWVVKKRA